MKKDDKSHITITEHSSIRKGSAFAVNPPVISGYDFDRIGRLNEWHKRNSGFTPLLMNHNSIKARQYVGTIAFGKHAIEILPKTDDLAIDDTSARTHLLTMLAATRRLPILEAEAYHYAVQSTYILEIFIRIFCNKLYHEIHRGMLSRYESRTENIGVVKGKIYLPEQIKHNLVHCEKFFCQYDSFEVDNPINRILKATLRLIVLLPQTGQSQNLVQELLFIFDGVSDQKISRHCFSSLLQDRTTARYAEVLEMAKLLIFGQSTDVSIDQQQMFSILFDMNKLFEEYIGRQITRTDWGKRFDCAVPGKQMDLAMRYIGTSSPGETCFRLKPDITIRDKSGYGLIVDTKWKLLNPEEKKYGIAQGDLYQMLAYAKKYDCASVLLLYPMIQPADAVYFKVDDINIHVRNVSLKELHTSKDSVKEQLEVMLNDLFQGCYNQ